MYHHSGERQDWHDEVSKLCEEEFGVGVLMWEYGEKSR